MVEYYVLSDYHEAHARSLKEWTAFASHHRFFSPSFGYSCKPMDMII